MTNINFYQGVGRYNPTSKVIPFSSYAFLRCLVGLLINKNDE